MLFLCVAAAGCGTLRAGLVSGTEFASVSTERVLRPRFATRVFTSDGLNTADLYLTDLDEAVLDDPDRLAAATGQILHVHMFLRPKPGSTPIEPTAITVTARYIVLSAGRAGVYAGGGFLLPAGGPNGDRFGGSMRAATLRLVGRTEGFDDLIRSGVLSLRERGRNDPRAAALIGAAADRVALSVEPVEDSVASGAAFAGP